MSLFQIEIITLGWIAGACVSSIQNRNRKGHVIHTLVVVALGLAVGILVAALKHWADE